MAASRFRRRLAAGVLAICMASGAAAPVAAEQAARDASFAGDGLVTLDFDGQIDRAEAVAVQPDGKVVVAGSASIAEDLDIVVVRFRADGEADPTFGDGGMVLLDSGRSDDATALAIQPDGRILVGGSLGADELIVRLLPDGTLDPSFGDGGVLVPEVLGDNAWIATGGRVEAIAVDPGGGIVTAVQSSAGYERKTDLTLARYLPDGTTDTSFGAEGRTIVDTGSTAEAGYYEGPESLARLDDGAWAVVGHRYPPGDGRDTLVVRFRADGDLDTGFNGTGWRVLDFGTDEGVAALAQPGGRVVAAARDYSGTAAMARLLPSSALDPGFGTGGVVRVGPRLETVTADAQGRIVGAGPGPSYEVARFSPDGVLDTSFNGGRYRSDVGPSTEFPTSIAVQPDGRLVVAGFAFTSGSEDTDWMIERIALAPDPPPPPPAPARSGYWMLGSTGSVYAFGDAPHRGAPAGVPTTNLAATPSGAGYWVVSAGGAVRAFGDAPYLGGSPVLLPGESITSISARADGAGYWLFSDKGRAFSYGTARWLGYMGLARLNGPVLGSVATPSGDGYYMVASDGGVFAFGDAVFRGSMGAARLNGPVVGLAPDPDGQGYWLVASDGGVFAFDAPFRGSMGGRPLNRPVVGLVAYGNGYLMVASDGGIFSFSDRPFAGSLGANPPADPIVAVAPLPR